MEQRRADPQDDLISGLVHAEIDEDGVSRMLTLEEIVAFVQLISSAGTETVARLLGFAAVTLGRHPDQRQLLVDDPTLIPNAVEELLRYEAPSPTQSRWVARDVELHGTVVKRGSKISLLNGSGDRDERHFEDPDRFDVRRDIDRHLAFGYGTHFCVGAALARLEGTVALRETLRRFPTWEVDESRLERVHTSTVRGYSLRAHAGPLTWVHSRTSASATSADSWPGPAPPGSSPRSAPRSSASRTRSARARGTSCAASPPFVDERRGIEMGGGFNNHNVEKLGITLEPAHRARQGAAARAGGRLRRGHRELRRGRARAHGLPLRASCRRSSPTSSTCRTPGSARGARLRVQDVGTDRAGGLGPHLQLRARRTSRRRAGASPTWTTWAPTPWPSPSSPG